LIEVLNEFCPKAHYNEKFVVKIKYRNGRMTQY